MFQAGNIFPGLEVGYMFIDLQSQLNQNSDQKTVSVKSQRVNDSGFAENVSLQLFDSQPCHYNGEAATVPCNKISVVSPLKHVLVKTAAWLDLAWRP